MFFLNTVIILGRIISFGDKSQDNVLVRTMTVEVPRPFSNSDGVIENDQFIVEFWRGISDMIIDNLPLNSVIAVKGRLQSDKGYSIIIAEKVTFIKK